MAKAGRVTFLFLLGNGHRIKMNIIVILVEPRSDLQLWWQHFVFFLY